MINYEQLYIQAHQAAWEYERDRNIKMDVAELKTFVENFIRNAQKPNW